MVIGNVPAPWAPMADSHPDIPDFQEMYSLAYLTGYIWYISLHPVHWLSLSRPECRSLHLRQHPSDFRQTASFSGRSRMDGYSFQQVSCWSNSARLPDNWRIPGGCSGHNGKLYGALTLEVLRQSWTYVNTLDTKSWKAMQIFLILPPPFAVASYSR